MKGRILKSMKLKFDPDKPKFELVKTTDRLKEILENELKDKDIIAVDVEGTHLDPYRNKLILAQIATENEAFILDAQKVDLTLLKNLFENKKPLKLLQNGKFDYEIFKISAGIEIINIYDTMLAERILTAGDKRDASLEALARKYLDISLDKSIRETFGKTPSATPDQLKYAALDVLVLFPIFQAQYPKLEKENLIRTAKLEFTAIPVVAEMELRGVRIDTKKWRENIAEMVRKRDEMAKKIQMEFRPFYKNSQFDLFGNQVEAVNLNSPAQVIEAFKKMGVDLPSTGEAILKAANHPVAKLLLEYRTYEKLITAFGENLLSKINPKTGRLHPDFIQIGADTGRFACSSPNLQQIPTDSMFRSCFIPAESYKFVVADYSQIELRVMAELSEDPEFMKAYKEDKDLHTVTASQMYGVPIDKVDKRMRRAAKDINFGLMYGRGAASLASQLEVSVDEAKRLLNSYFQTYKKVKNWIDKVGRMAIQQGYSETLGGRKRWYRRPDPSDPNYNRLIANTERQGKNTPIQGTSADMTKYALCFIFERIKKEKLDAYLILTVHDEILVEARTDQAEILKKLMIEEMVRAGNLLLKRVPVKVDAVVSNVWEH